MVQLLLSDKQVNISRARRLTTPKGVGNLKRSHFVRLIFPKEKLRKRSDSGDNPCNTGLIDWFIGKEDRPIY